MSRAQSPALETGQTCPKCSDVSPWEAHDCGGCGARLGVHASRVPTGRCIYCGHRCKGRACLSHRDLLAVDNSVEGGDK